MTIAVNGVSITGRMMGISSTPPPVIIEPIYVSSGTYQQGSATGINLSMPSSYQAGDFLVAVCATLNESVEPPAGWTQFNGSPVGAGTSGGTSGGGVVAFYKFATASEEPIFLLTAGGYAFSAVTFAFRNVNTTTPVSASSGVAVTTLVSASSPSVTTTMPSSMILTIVGHGVDSTNPQISSWTNNNLISIVEIFDDSSSLGAGTGIACATAIKSTVGETGNTIIQGPIDRAGILTIALNPATS